MVGIGHSGHFPGADSEQEKIITKKYEKKKTITKKIEKMSDDEAKGFQSELGTLAV